MARSFVLSWDGERIAIGDPMNSKYAQLSLAAMAQLQDAGWQVSDLWTPAHYGIPGNEGADMLAKQGAQASRFCWHTRVTRSWLQASARQQVTADRNRKFTAEPQPPIAPRSPHFREALLDIALHLRVLYFDHRLKQLHQTPIQATHQRDASAEMRGPQPDRTSFREARTDLLPTLDVQPCSDTAFLCRRGLGFPGIYAMAPWVTDQKLTTFTSDSCLPSHWTLTLKLPLSVLISGCDYVFCIDVFLVLLPSLLGMS